MQALGTISSPPTFPRVKGVSNYYNVTVCAHLPILILQGFYSKSGPLKGEKLCIC